MRRTCYWPLLLSGGFGICRICVSWLVHLHVHVRLSAEQMLIMSILQPAAVKAVERDDQLYLALQASGAALAASQTPQKGRPASAAKEASRSKAQKRRRSSAVLVRSAAQSSGALLQCSEEIWLDLRASLLHALSQSRQP